MKNEVDLFAIGEGVFRFMKVSYLIGVNGGRSTPDYGLGEMPVVSQGTTISHNHFDPFAQALQKSERGSEHRHRGQKATGAEGFAVRHRISGKLQLPDHAQRHHYETIE